jgi:phage terminase large subunit
MVDEIYQTRLTNPELDKLLKEKDTQLGIEEYELATMDAASASDIVELQQLGQTIVPCKKETGESGTNYVTWKIQKLSERLKSGKFHFHPRCINTVQEFEYYRYPENKTELNEKEAPEKVNDHMMDSIGDLNSYYQHYYQVKTDPFKDKIPGTYVKPITDTSEDDSNIYDEADYSANW